MKKIYIYITFPIFSFFYFSLVPVHAAASSEGSRSDGASAGFASAHSQHPPHNHEEVDHLKYIRTRDEKKKKKPL